MGCSVQRILGIDYGDKRIGLAISDYLGVIAQGLGVIPNEGRKKVFPEIAKIIEEHQVSKVVLGMPRNMNGTYGPMSDKIQRFGRRLQQELGIEVIYQDERMSTMTAEQVLIQGDVSRSNRKKVVDKLAAQVILQSYLDRL